MLQLRAEWLESCAEKWTWESWSTLGPWASRDQYPLALWSPLNSHHSDSFCFTVVLLPKTSVGRSLGYKMQKSIHVPHNGNKSKTSVQLDLFLAGTQLKTQCSFNRKNLPSVHWKFKVKSKKHRHSPSCTWACGKWAGAKSTTCLKKQNTVLYTAYQCSCWVEPSLSNFPTGESNWITQLCSLAA